MAIVGRHAFLVVGLLAGCAAPANGAPPPPAILDPAGPAEALRREAALDRLGTVTFPISCNAEAKREFDRGVALLHSFWYDRAASRFEAAAQADPSCGMAFWGKAMALYHPLWTAPTPEEVARGAGVVKQGLAAGAGTQRERDYLEAIASYFGDPPTRTHRERAAAYEAKMAGLAERYPDDPEARIFHALALLGTVDPKDKTYEKQKRAGEVLMPLFEKMPDHPGVAHYIIHAYDYPELAKLALPAARRYAEIAPASPHALHMPSHIFTRLGLWDEAIASNLASTRAAQASFDRLHAMDYLMYAYLQKGDEAKAKALLDELAAIPAADLDPPNFAAAYALAAMPARHALERGKWEEARRLGLKPADFPWDRFPYAKAIIHYARALGAARGGDPAQARSEIRALELLRDALDRSEGPYWRDQVEIYRLTAAAWLALGDGDRKEALSLMRAATDLEAGTEKHPVTPGAILPARQLLGDLYRALGEPAAARREYEAAGRELPGRRLPSI